MGNTEERIEWSVQSNTPRLAVYIGLRIRSLKTAHEIEIRTKLEEDKFYDDVEVAYDVKNHYR